MASKRTAARKAAQQQQAKADRVRICGAEKRNGSPCGREAGWGTDHEGRGRCKQHTGSTRSGDMVATKEKIAGMAKPANVSPAQAMGAVLRLAAGQLLYITQQIATLEDEAMFIQGYDPESGKITMVANHWLVLQSKKMEELAKYAKIAADAGIADRNTSLAERQTEIVSLMLERVVGRLDLTPKQRQGLGPAIREEMQTIDLEPAAVAA